MLAALLLSLSLGPSRLGSHRPAASRLRARLVLQAPDPPEPPAPPPEPEQRPQAEETDLSDEFEAGLSYGREIRSRFTAPRIDDPGLPLTDALVCISGSLFIAQWALSPAVPAGLKIPPPSWLAPTPLPGGFDWRGVPYILSTVSHGTTLAAWCAPPHSLRVALQPTRAQEQPPLPRP